MAWIDSEREPTKHVLNDLPLLKTELDTWGGGFIFLVDPASSASAINSHDLKGLPANSVSVFDKHLGILKSC